MSAGERGAEPIKFGADMASLVYQGLKTQTRRPMKPQPELDGGMWDWKMDEMPIGYFWPFNDRPMFDLFAKWCKYGKVGDILFVQEPAWYWEGGAEVDVVYMDEEDADVLPRDNAIFDQARMDKPELFKGVGSWVKRGPEDMVIGYTRSLLVIKRVWIERLQDIEDNEADQVAEGAQVIYNNYPAQMFKQIWNSFYGETIYKWDVNPWVWCIEFEREKSE